MKKSKIQLSLFFSFVIIFSFSLTAQQNLITLFENYDPVEDDIFEDTDEIIYAKEEAWAGIETSDGGLLVVGTIDYKIVTNKGATIDEKQGFIRRYHFPDLSNDPQNPNNYTTYTQHTKLFTEWREIRDIISIGNDQYIIVGLLDGTTANTGQLGKNGIAIISDNSELSEDSRLYFTTLDREFRGIRPETEEATVNAVIRHEGTSTYTAVLFNEEANNSTFLLSFNCIGGVLSFNRISYPAFTDLRHPQNLAICGDYIVVAGQTADQSLVITSWTRDNLFFLESSYFGPDKHKPKMVSCAGPQGVIACGGFEYPSGGAALVKSLAYFPDPSDLGGNDPVNGVDPTFKYFNEEIEQIVDLNLDDFWTTNESYCEAVADRNPNGWIFAGQIGPNFAENMAAITVQNDGSETEFTITGYTDVFHGNSTGDDVDVANYVIQLSGQPNRYALFGKADWSGDVGNSYVVIVAETK